MKKTFATLFVIAFFVAGTSIVAKADLSLTQQYGINIKDTSSTDNAKLNLYGLFNSYFSDQLISTGEGMYENSNALFNARGVDPNMIWSTDDSTLSGAFKVAGYGHALNLTHGETTINTMKYLENTASLPVSEIIDINNYSNFSGLQVYDISKIINGVWELEVHQENDDVISYSLYSSSGKNSDELIHMIAFNITDLYNLKSFGDKKDMYVDTAFMFAWEDIVGDGADWDFQDFVGIVTNVKSGTADDFGNPTTPEPATLAMFALGLGALPITRRFTKTNK